MSTYGFVYVLANRLMPRIYKIGMTMRSPVARCEELSSPTGVPVPFDLIFYAEVEDPAQVEREIHSALVDVRVNPAREFFEFPLAQFAIDTVRQYAINSCLTSEGWHLVDSENDSETKLKVIQGGTK